MSGAVDSGILYNDAFAATDPITSEVLNISPSKFGTTIFVAPVGCDMDMVVEVQDPEGDWHETDSTPTTTLDGECDPINIPANLHRLRAVLTPSTAPGSAIVWAVSFGG
jgi:hypothetical protein